MQDNQRGTQQPREISLSNLPHSGVVSSDCGELEFRILANTNTSIWLALAYQSGKPATKGSCDVKQTAFDVRNSKKPNRKFSLLFSELFDYVLAEVVATNKLVEATTRMMGNLLGFVIVLILLLPPELVMRGPNYAVRFSCSQLCICHAAASPGKTAPAVRLYWWFVFCRWGFRMREIRFIFIIWFILAKNGIIGTDERLTN